MSLKINVPITSKNHGLLTEAMIKIENYRVNKFAGQAEVTVFMFKDEKDAELSKYIYADELHQPLIERRPLPGVVQVELIYDGKEIEYPTYLEFPLYTPEVMQQDVFEEGVKIGTKEIIRQRLDISIVENNLYSWCYAKVKEKFGEIFGIENISDC